MRAIENPKSADCAKRIIATLSFERISRNDNGEFWEIVNSYLAIGCRITEPSVVPNKFEFLGWYRFFNEKNVGPNIKIVSSFQQAVSSSDEAEMRLMEIALSEILVNPQEECADSIGALPDRLFIISSSASAIASTVDLLARETEPWPPFAPILKRNLQLMRSVDLCVTSKEMLREIYKLVQM
jgi:hypothetical protein